MLYMYSYRTCSKIERVCNTTIQNEMVTCYHAGTALGNRIIITKVDDGAMQINEVKPIKFEILKMEVKNNAGGLRGKYAFDGNLDSNFVTNEKLNATWFMTLNGVFEIKWILISMRGGKYEVYLYDKSQLEAGALSLCKALNLPKPASKYQIIVECNKDMQGDTLLIKRTDEGPMRLFEVHPRICPENHFGINCAKCRQACVSCNPISGVCKQCNGSLYGEYCQLQCPTTCLNTTCDKSTGSCNSCREGYNGKYCELQMSTAYYKVEVATKSTNPFWSKSGNIDIEFVKGI